MPSFEDEIEQKRLDAVRRIQTLPIAALIWGPAPNAGTPIAGIRASLKNELIANGHHARFSEDLIDPTLKLSVLTQQVTHAEAFDIVFSLPDSPGSIAELHDFARIPSVAPKIVAFIDNRWNSGYSNSALMQLESTATCRIQTYDHTSLPNCILDPALRLVARLQEFYYLSGRRF